MVRLKDFELELFKMHIVDNKQPHNNTDDTYFIMDRLSSLASVIVFSNHTKCVCLYYNTAITIREML